MKITKKQKEAIKLPCMMFAKSIMAIYDIDEIPDEVGSPTHDLKAIDKFFLLEKSRLELTDEECEIFVKFLESQLKMQPDRTIASSILKWVDAQTKLIQEVYDMMKKRLN